MALDRTAFDALVDDSGDGASGTVVNKALIASVLLDPIDAAFSPPAQTLTSTGAQADLSINSRLTTLRLNNASLLTISGIAAGYDGQRLLIISIGAGQVDFLHQSTNSAAANRLVNIATSAPTSLAPGLGTALYLYDATLARWRLINHDQGGWIAWPFNAANFTGSVSMTWTVEAADVTQFVYRLVGKYLTVAVQIKTTTVGGTVDKELRVAIPNGFTCTSQVVTLCRITDNVTTQVGLVVVPVTGGYMAAYTLPSTAGNWTLQTNTAQVYFTVTFEVN